MKIISSLVKHLQSTVDEKAFNKGETLMSNEILSSLLLNFDQKMGQHKNEMKFLLKNFVFEKDLIFLQDYCVKSLNKLSDLILYFNVPLNLFSRSSNLDEISFMQFMFEMKRRFLQRNQRVDRNFIINLWNLLKEE